MMLSVIVPIYNMEKYLARCLESIVYELSQFDPKEVELLLINDGSKDSSATICNSYMDKYSYIRVMNQTNQGLSNVRNRGIKEARGKYISFVDSDDFVNKGYYTHFIYLLEKYSADIYCFRCAHYFEGMQRKTVYIDEKKERIELLDKKEALNLIFYENYIDIITCNKIIRKECFDNVQYPEGRLFEDMFTTYKIVSNANSIIFSTLPYYAYCHRPGSIGTSQFNDKTYDLVDAARETYMSACEICGDTDELKVGLLYWEIVVANKMIKSKKIDTNYIVEIRNKSRNIWCKVLKNKKLSAIRKVELILFGIDFNLYKSIYEKYISCKWNS